MVVYEYAQIYLEHINALLDDEEDEVVALLEVKDVMVVEMMVMLQVVVEQVVMLLLVEVDEDEQVMRVVEEIELVEYSLSDISVENIQ